MALAATGAEVLAIEFDRGLVPALEEVVGELPGVHVQHADAMRLDWPATLGGGRWVLCANLPYNIGTPLVLDLLRDAPGIERFVVMIQREVGERLAAGPGDEGYGAVSVRVAYHAAATLVRRVPREVFWPRPNVASVVVRLDRHLAPPVDVDQDRLWRVVDAGFAERRKTMRNALRRLGLDAAGATEVLASCGVSPNARAEELDLPAFTRLAEALPA
jgi:16S rRNA (adenine1518-N6/adenine1519-N6)-dimethyltransferase